MLEKSEFEKIKGFDPVNDRVDKMILDKVISESKTASKRILSNRIFAREKTAVQMRLSQRQKIFSSSSSLNATEDDREHSQLRPTLRFSRRESAKFLIDDPGE